MPIAKSIFFPPARITLAKLTQKIERINPLRMPIAPVELNGITANHLGLPKVDVGIHDFVRLQNAQRIHRRGGGAPRFRAGGTRAFPPQKCERVNAAVTVIPRDFQRPGAGFFYINGKHNLRKKIGFFTETVYIIANFAQQIKHFY